MGPYEAVAWPFRKGDPTSRRELAKLVGYSDETPLQRGMVQPRQGPHTNRLLLFHDPQKNPYGDLVGRETIEYVGQGQAGDQSLAAQNRYLAEHLQRGLAVSFFIKESPGQFVYEGDVICRGYERVFRPEEGRSVLKFSLVRMTDSPDEGEDPLLRYADAREEILQEAEPSLIDRVVRLSLADRVIRDVAFRDAVLQAYKKTCAVCGPPLVRGRMVDLEAAHIVGVAERGPDHRRNGLSLCHRHHWAFDHGIFSLTPELRIHNLMDHDDPHAEIIDGETILIPSEPRLTPYPEFVSMHRTKWAIA